MAFTQTVLWHNPEHVKDVAARWNVEPKKLPHWHSPHHAMEIFREAELGSLNGQGDGCRARRA
jgi:hypothetical protein